MNNGSAFTICPAEGYITSPTPYPEPSQPSPRSTVRMPELTTDGELKRAAMQKQKKWTEPVIAPEPKPRKNVDLSDPTWLLSPSAPPDTIVHLHRPPSSLLVRLGQTSFCLCHGFLSRPLHPVGSTSVLRHSGSTSDAYHCGSATAFRIIGVSRSHLLSICTQGSISIGSILVHHPLIINRQASTMTPSSLPQLRRGPSSWLRPGSTPGYFCSCLLPS